MEKGEYYMRTQWLLTETEWMQQPNIGCSSKTKEEERPVKEIVAYTKEQKADEWDMLLTFTILEGTGNNSMGPPFQGQQPIKVSESKEGARAITHSGAVQRITG